MAEIPSGKMRAAGAAEQALQIAKIAADHIKRLHNKLKSAVAQTRPALR